MVFKLLCPFSGPASSLPLSFLPTSPQQLLWDLRHSFLHSWIPKEQLDYCLMLEKPVETILPTREIRATFAEVPPCISLECTFLPMYWFIWDVRPQLPTQHPGERLSGCLPGGVTYLSPSLLWEEKHLPVPAATWSQLHSTLWVGRRLEGGASWWRRQALPFSLVTKQFSHPCRHFTAEIQGEGIWSHASKSSGNRDGSLCWKPGQSPMLIPYSSYLFAWSELISQL